MRAGELGGVGYGGRLVGLHELRKRWQEGRGAGAVKDRVA